MKDNVILKLFMITALFFLSSCKEYFITTKVNSDGTCERTIVVKSDDGADPETISNITETGWNINVSYDSSSKKYIHTAKKTFASYTEMITDAGKPKTYFKPIPIVHIEKQFRLFFTYYTYKETYKPYNVFNKVPIDKYFTETDIAKIKEYKDTAWIKHKLSEYDRMNLIIEFLDIAEVELLKSEGLKLPCLTDPEKKKELINELMTAMDAKDNDNNKREKEIFRKYCGEQAGAKFDKLIDKNPQLERMYELMKEYEGKYNNSVILPGIITSSNSKIIEGNKVSWNYDQDEFKYFDYEMFAESREVNTWVIIIAGAVVLLLILGLTLPRLKRKPAF